MTKLVALIGHPLQHSISPAFQQAAFDYCGLDVCYEKWETEGPHLETVIERLRQASVLGANVTIPHKEVTMALLDEVDTLAAEIGAVNTLVNRDGRLSGYNTDASGFTRALRQEGEFEPGGRCVVVLGAGGAARAACFALAKEDVRRLTIVNRTLGRAESLADWIRRQTKADQEVVALPWEGLMLDKGLSSCDLLVNCTSLGMRHSPWEGMTPLDAESIPSNALVYDLVYNPVETPLLRQAKIAGARVLEGLAMLVYQGAASFEIWVAREAPVDIMFRAARESLA
jgi:shikimate dehydrogenase